MPPPRGSARKRGLRWPWLLGTVAVTVTAGLLLLRAVDMAFQLGTSDDEQYTGWVGAPPAGACFLALVVSIVTFAVLCFRRWNQQIRNVMVAICVLFSLTIGSWGLYESAARRHIGPALADAVRAVPRPAGSTSPGPVVVNSDVPSAYLDLLGEPSARQEWDLATDTEAAACAEVRQLVAGRRGWQPWGICGFRRVQGRVLVFIDVEGIRAPNSILVSASPND